MKERATAAADIRSMYPATTCTLSSWLRIEKGSSASWRLSWHLYMVRMDVYSMAAKKTKKVHIEVYS